MCSSSTVIVLTARSSECAAAKGKNKYNWKWGRMLEKFLQKLLNMQPFQWRQNKTFEEAAEVINPLSSQEVVIMPVSGQGGMPFEGRFHLSWNLTFPWGIPFTKLNTIPLFIDRFSHQFLCFRESFPCSALSSYSLSSSLHHHQGTLWAVVLSSILLSLQYKVDALGIQHCCLFRWKPPRHLQEKHTEPQLSMAEESYPWFWKLQYVPTGNSPVPCLLL